MTLKNISPKKALNVAYRLIKPKRQEIELFKGNLIRLLSRIDEKETEENVKIHLMDFIKNTWYRDNYLVATKGRTDFVIHTGKEASTNAGVLFEVKRPNNLVDMVSRSNLNAKAMHELILYYLRERVNGKNIDIRHLVITNIYEWFIFDVSVFEKLFFKNAKLVKAFKDWESGQKVSTNTDLFYKEIAKPFIEELKEEISFAWFDIRDYNEPLKNEDKTDDNKLIALYKIFSPIHLLKLQFANDSNSLDKDFYVELLHIIGLEEIKDGNKKIITRKNKDKRDAGSLLENTITILDLEDSLHKVNDIGIYGDNRDERLFNLGLELCITWINRILFLKLLEAQLIKYHKGDQTYKFLNYTTIPQYDELYKLFFQVLAKRPSDRTESINKKFGNIPYLNSSLFEISEIEDQTIKINSLDDSLEVPLWSGTILKDSKNKAIAKSLNGLQYLFDFLEAYDFASEGSEEIQEDSKTLINASVLGLIFEKINGYKDGSIFTPGFITMYMCRQSIRLAVMEKFKVAYGWKCEAFDDLKNYIADRRNSKDILEFNNLINSMHLCDPAVGSGHFLVSSLNEIIGIKSELGILADDKGIRLSGYDVEIENDELIITCNEGQDIFEYQINKTKIDKETQRVQKTLFHEKQTIIENCLFGVDINPNSVKICRLRLWIELLKNAYYTDSTNFQELETLPNIDINIKCGNSLISRFPLDSDLSKALKSIKYNINQYKDFVNDYKNAHDKELKRGLEQIINSIKNDFRVEINNNSKEIKDLNRWKSDLINLTTQTGLFEKTAKEKKDFDLEVKKYADKIVKQELIIEDIKNNVIYRNAFEWRFEFPEVLNNEGEFEGFDVIVGNPPYINSKGDKFGSSFKSYASTNYKTAKYQIDTYILFIEKSAELISTNGSISYIVPNAWLNNLFLADVRKHFLDTLAITEICKMPNGVFSEASVDTIIFTAKNSKYIDSTNIVNCVNQEFKLQHTYKQSDFLLAEGFNINVNSDNHIDKIILQVEKNSLKLENFTSIARGVGVYHKRVGHTKEIIEQDPYQAVTKKDKTFVPYLRGKNVKPFKVEWNDDSFISYGKWLAEPREPKYFEGQRIILRQIPGKKLIATFIEKQFITDQSVFIARFENTKIEPKAVLGVIGSKLMSFYFRNKYSEFDELFPKVKLQHFKNFPISKKLHEDQSKIVSIVDLIMELKLKGTDTEKQDAQLDALIYKLYDLSPEEIALVEISFESK